MACKPRARANVDLVTAPFVLVPGCTGKPGCQVSLRPSWQVCKVAIATQGPLERDFSAGSREITPSSFYIFFHNRCACVVVIGP